MTQMVQDFLTEEEKAILDDTKDIDDGEKIEDPPGEPGDEGEDAKGGGEATPPKEDPPPAAAPVADPPADPPAAPAPDAAVLDRAHPPVMLVADPPVDFDKKMADLEARKAEFDEQMDRGEIAASEYRKGLEVITKQQYDLQRQKDEADFVDRQNNALAEETWVRMVNDYAGKHPELATSIARAAWNVSLTGLLQEKGNETKEMTWFLAESHRRMRTSLGLDAAPAPAAPAAPPPPERKPPGAPTTLRTVAPAAPTDTGHGDEFASIDAMEGIDQEVAIMSLEKRDPAAYKRYLMGA